MFQDSRNIFSLLSKNPIPPSPFVVNSRKRYLPSDFCMESSLHGLKFIGQPQRHTVERCFWGISFIIAVVVATFFILQIWQKYNKTPVMTVFPPKETAIGNLPFPAVTICNTNNVLKAKAEEFMLRSKADPTDAEANGDLDLLEHVCETSKTFAETFNFSLRHDTGKRESNEFETYPSGPHSIRQKIGKRITDLLQDVSQKCSDMIILCLWNDEAWNCSQIFDEVETDFGYCCVFNMIPLSLLLTLRNDSRDTEEKFKDWESLHLNTDNIILHDEDNGDEKVQTISKYPRRQNRPGRTTGLSVLLDPDLESYFCSNTDSVGFMTLAHLPLSFPRMADEGIAIKPNSETYLKIRPEIILAEEEIRYFSLEKRNCYFNGEQSLKYYEFYTQSNCENECIANITYNECHCVRYFMPRDDNQAICGAKNYKCCETVRKRLLQQSFEKICKICLPSCTEIEYEMTTSYMPLRSDIRLWEYKNGSSAPWANKNVSILHVHFAVDSTYPKLRKELYGFIDLLCNTGGLLGLCLGFSALSLLEIIYFVTLRLYCETSNGKIMGRKLNKLSQKLWLSGQEGFKLKGSTTIVSNCNNGELSHIENGMYGQQKLSETIFHALP